nr:protein ACCELERATED CELL DEATH 6-like [Arachis hypogaea]
MNQQPEACETEASSLHNGVEDEPESVSVIVKHSEHESLEFLGQVYHQARGGAATTLTQESYYYSFNILREFKTPTRNTVLHVAALYGNDEKAYCVARQEPDLVVFFNENQDTPLHVAARAGHFSIIKTLLDAYWVNSNNNVAHLLQLLKMKNRIPHLLHQYHSLSLSQSCYEFALYEINYEARSVLYLAVECKLTEAVYRILDKCPENATPKGISPLVQAIMGRDKEMLTTIADKKEECIHLREWDGRLALHVAAETGYHEGVVYLLERCKPCSIRRDILGFLPLHLAARHGHLEVVKELLGYCPDLDEMLDAGGNNILHIAAKGGELNMVNFILQTPLLEKMINQRNIEGETPLHVATSHGEAKIVHALTWDNRVDLNVVNSSRKGGQTPLDIANRNFYAAAASKVAPFERQVVVLISTS